MSSPESRRKETVVGSPWAGWCGSRTRYGYGLRAAAAAAGRPGFYSQIYALASIRLGPHRVPWILLSPHHLEGDLQLRYLSGTPHRRPLPGRPHSFISAKAEQHFQRFQWMEMIYRNCIQRKKWRLKFTSFWRRFTTEHFFFRKLVLSSTTV